MNAKLGKPIYDCTLWEEEWKPHQSCGCQLPVPGDFSIPPPPQASLKSRSEKEAPGKGKSHSGKHTLHDNTQTGSIVVAATPAGNIADA